MKLFERKVQILFSCVFCTIRWPWALCVVVKKVISRGDFGGCVGPNHFLLVLLEKTQKDIQETENHTKHGSHTVFAGYGGHRFPVMCSGGRFRETILVARVGPSR